MTTAKHDRIEVRSTTEEKKEFEEAAVLAHVGLSEFMRLAAHYYAKKLREDYHNIVLAKEDGLRFLAALENPPEPNEKLKEAMREYKKARKQ